MEMISNKFESLFVEKQNGCALKCVENSVYWFDYETNIYLKNLHDPTIHQYLSIHQFHLDILQGDLENVKYWIEEQEINPDLAFNCSFGYKQYSTVPAIGVVIGH